MIAALMLLLVAAALAIVLVRARRRRRDEIALGRSFDRCRREIDTSLRAPRRAGQRVLALDNHDLKCDQEAMKIRQALHADVPAPYCAPEPVCTPAESYCAPSSYDSGGGGGSDSGSCSGGE